jgi:hypothetical protein
MRPPSDPYTASSSLHQQGGRLCHSLTASCKCHVKVSGYPSLQKMQPLHLIPTLSSSIAPLPLHVQVLLTLDSTPSRQLSVTCKSYCAALAGHGCPARLTIDQGNGDISAALTKKQELACPRRIMSMHALITHVRAVWIAIRLPARTHAEMLRARLKARWERWLAQSSNRLLGTRKNDDRICRQNPSVMLPQHGISSPKSDTWPRCTMRTLQPYLRNLPRRCAAH